MERVVLLQLVKIYVRNDFSLGRSCRSHRVGRLQSGLALTFRVIVVQPPAIQSTKCGFKSQHQLQACTEIL